MMNNLIKTKDLIILLAVILIGFLIVYNNPSLTGFAINSYNGENLQKLKITSMCSAEPDVYRVWRVQNKNDIDLEFNWDIYGTSQNSSGIALADGYTYFNTTTVSGSNTVRIFVNASQHDVKASGSAKCSAEPAPCLENWTCSNWGACINKTQTRICVCANACNTTISIPVISQACEEQPAPCPENWSCGNWSKCSGGNQTQICSDLNACNTALLTLELSQICEEQNLTNQTQQNETIANQTQENQTNQTETNQTIANENLNETVLQQTTAESSSSSDSSGGSSSNKGGSSRGASSPELTINSSISQNNQNYLSNASTESSLNKTQESAGFIHTIGNAIKIPLDTMKNFFANKSRIYCFVFFASCLVAILACSFLFRYLRKKWKIRKLEKENQVG